MDISYKKPNVLLVIPRYASSKTCGYIMPLGILYVSSALKLSGVANVFTLNLNHHDQEDRTVLSETIQINQIDMVGCGGISGQFIDIFPLFKLVKEIAPQTTIIVGGGVITADAPSAMTAFEGLADYGVIGEGEITVVELIDAIARSQPLDSIKGIIYSKDNNWFTTQRREDIDDLDAIPLPDYKGFDYDKYLAANGEIENNQKYSPVAIIGGRSCKYNCTFCFHPTGSHYRQRSLNSIFLEIDYLLANYSVNYIALREELFSSDLERVFEFCQRIVHYPILWSIQLRVDSVNQALVDALKKSNCRYIFLGIESVDNDILKSMRKMITFEQIEQALNRCIKSGLDTRSTIILGDEIETVASAQKTLNWWKVNRKFSSISLDMIIAFPGSTLYKRARNSNRIPDPVAFLHAGCPIINLSKHLSDQQYEELVNEVSQNNGINYQIYHFD